MKYRSISSHRGMPDPQVIDLAASLGFNDVCFQIEGEQQVMLRELRERWDRSGTPAQIKAHGMTISLWVHEFEDIDPAWGELTVANTVLWDNLRARYRHLLTEFLPEVDWLVLTVVESTVRVTDPAMLQHLVLMLREVCAETGKQLMIRSFVWTLEEFAGVRSAIEQLPDDVTVMTKYVPQDWHRGVDAEGKAFHDPLIGQVGAKDQIVELDIAGEYFRGNQIAHCFAEELRQRWDFWTANGVDGLSVRIDRGWRAYHHHDCILNEVQESNLWCLGRWMTGASDSIDEPLREWAAARFAVASDSHAAGELAAIARACDRVVAEMLTVCGEPFGDTRRPYPALRSMLPPKEAPATIDQPAQAANHGNPFNRWLALWRWDKTIEPRYAALRTGDPAMAAQKAADTATAVSIADQALNRLAGIEDQLDSGAYAVLRFRLEENRHHLVLFGHCAQAWLACLRLPHVTDRDPVHAEIEQHLAAVMDEWDAHHHEAATVVWPAGTTRYLQRAATIDMPGFCREMRRYASIGPTPHTADDPRYSVTA